MNVEAQKRKKSKQPVEIEAVEDDVPVVEEIRVVEVAPESSSYAQLRNENGPLYMYDSYTSKDVAVVYQGSGYDNRQYGLLKISTQTQLTPLVFESISAHFSQSNYATVSINGKYGTVNNKGEVVIPCIYERLYNFFIDEQIFFIATANGYSGVIDESNGVLIPFLYTTLNKMYGQTPYLQAKLGNKLGVIDPISKKTTIPFLYDEIESYNGNILRVKKDAQYNLLDPAGNVMFSKWYASLYLHDETLFIARYQGKDGVIDLQENTVIPFEYEKIERSYLDGPITYIVQKNGKYGLIARDGTVPVPIQYDYLRNFSGGNLIASRDNKKGIISKEGKVLMPVDYEEIERNDRNIVVRKNGKFGLLTRDFQPLLPMEYDDIQQMGFDGSYSISYYLVTKNGKKGVMDISGKTVIDVLYDNFVPVSNNYRMVFKQPLVAIKGGKYGMIDLYNKPVVPFEYDHLQPLNSFLLIVGKKGKFGVREIYNMTADVLPVKYTFVAYKQGNNLVAYNEAEGYARFRVAGNKITPLTEN